LATARESDSATCAMVYEQKQTAITKKSTLLACIILNSCPSEKATGKDTKKIRKSQEMTVLSAQVLQISRLIPRV
jgi:hypothetical protein